MSLTYEQLKLLVEEIDELAAPSGVQKVFGREQGGFVLQLRGRGATRYLLVDADPPWPRVHFIQGKPPQPERPTGFVMLLRKYLVGTGLGRVVLRDDDRIVELELSRRIDEQTTELGLVVELFGSGRVELVRPTVSYSAPEPPPTLSADDPWQLADLSIGERSSFVSTTIDELIDQKQRSERRRRLTSELKREARRASRLVANLQSDLERAEAAQQYRRRGELLQSAYSLDVPRGAKSVRVPDFYEAGTPEVEIALDPARNLQQNIERYFHEYRRYNGAIDQIGERLLVAMDRNEALVAARAALAALGDEDLEAHELHLRSAGFLKRRNVQRVRGRATVQRPYRTFLGRSGAKILVGRGAKQNDKLTTKVARGRDVWMHARDWAGAHVVLRMDKDDEPDGEDLRDGALLAAHFSKGRGDSLVDVTYTRAKWVRKPKGAAPGLVTVAGGSTIGVAPDEARLAQLFAQEVLDE